MLENDYPSHDQLLHIDWHHAGVFDNASSSARAAYYGSGSAPDVYFDGGDHILGAGDSTSAYNTYKPIVDDHYLNQGSKAIMSASIDIDAGTMIGTITVNFEVAPGETVGTPANCMIRAALYENNIVQCCEPQTNRSVWNNIARLMILQTTLTASLPGQTQQVVQSFAVDPAWKVKDLHAVAWVQRDSNKQVLQAAYAYRNYDCALAALDPDVARSTGGVTDFDHALEYTGLVTDDVIVTLDESSLPAGWQADIVWNSTVYPTSVTIPAMANGDTENVTVRVTPSGPPAMGDIVLVAEPAGNQTGAVGGSTLHHTFYNTPAILFVDDDFGATFETQFESAITGSGHFSLTHEVNIDGNPAASRLALFDVVVWDTGAGQFQTIPTAVANTIQTFLNAGGKFFLSSQGYLNEMGLSAFAQNYLRVSGMSLDVGAPTVTGVAGDPIGDGLSFPCTPIFSNLADRITPNTAGGGVGWLVSGANNVGVRYDSGVFRTVFMTAPFQGVAPPNDALLMDRVIDWLYPPNPLTGVHPAESAVAARLVLEPNAPNPFRGATTLWFAVPKAGAAALSVFDVTGRRVRDLVNRHVEAGPQAVVWDGRDAQGSRVASGVYLVRLTAGGESVSREIVRIE